MNSFSDHESLCDLPPEQVAAYLDDIGDHEGASTIRQAGVQGQAFGLGFQRKWMATGHHFGFIGGQNEAGLNPIEPVGAVEPDQSLLGSQIKVSLEKFRVADYPGFGSHTIILEVLGRNQAGSEKEDLRFTSTFTVRDGDEAGANGLPIFTGLTAPPDGLAFEARTISVRASGSEALIGALRSDAFRQGLRLIGQVQPVLPQFVQLAAGVTANILDNSKNKQVQKFALGLDFNGPQTSARLRAGSYVVVQAPDDGSWRWRNWFYDGQAGGIYSLTGELMPYNYMIIGISKSGESDPLSASRTSESSAGPPAKKPRKTVKA